MFRLLSVIVLVVSLAHAEEVWVGLRVGDYDDKGKYEVNYYAGQVSTDDIKRLRDGGTPDGFIEVRNVLYINTDDDTYEMNSDGKYNKEESDTYLVKIRLINQLIYLKDDPRRIYKQKDKAAQQGKDPDLEGGGAAPQKPSLQNW
jgi:hypothetical protein